MYVKFPPRDLNPGLCPPHPTSTYTYGVTIATRVCSDTAFLENIKSCQQYLLFYHSPNKIFQKIASKPMT